MPTVEINTSCNPVWVTIPDGATETLAASYAAGTAAVDQTLLIQAADGGPVIFQANAAATGSLVQAQTSTAVVLFNITDNASQVIRSAMADGAAAIALTVDTTTSWTNATAKLLSIQNNASERVYIGELGEYVSSTAAAIGTAQTPYITLENTTAATSGAGNQQWSPGVQLTGRQWNGAASVAVDWMIQQRPITGGVDSGALAFLGRYNAGAWTDLIELLDNAGAPQIRSGQLPGSYLQLGNNITIAANGNFIIPAADNTILLGNPGGGAWNAVASNWFTTKIGSQITAANTITPTQGTHHVTGATVIKTIATTNVPGDGATFTLIADTSTVNWDATGNIAVAGAVTTALRAIIFTWDATAVKWYPSDVA